MLMVSLFVGSLGAIYLHSLWFEPKGFSALNLPLRPNWDVKSTPRNIWMAVNSNGQEQSIITVYQIPERISGEGDDLAEEFLYQKLQAVDLSKVQWQEPEYPLTGDVDCVLIQGTTSREVHTLCVLAREDQTLWVIHLHHAFTGENPPSQKTLQEALEQDYHVVVGYALKGR